MEIKLISGATSYEAGVNVLRQIDCSNLDETNLVVVPDGFSMQAESLVFDVLKINSTFNIEVVGISRLASKLLRRNNIEFSRISGIEEVLCIFNAVRKNENDFKYFKKCGVEFCVKILQVVKQFKACRIKPTQIKQTGDELLDKKMHDLRLIYESYQESLGDKMDLSSLLEFFVDNAEKKINLSKTNLFFVNFDSFSSEIGSFICKLAKFVNKILIGMAKPLSVTNAYIYENDIFEKTTQLAKENGGSVQVEVFPTELTGEQLHMSKNLFAFDIQAQKSDFFQEIVARNKKDEIEFCAKYIKNRIVNGKRFKDFAVAVPDEGYFESIKHIFRDFDIPFYCDEAASLSETVLGRYLLKFLEIAKIGFSKASLQYITTLPLVCIEKEDSEISDVSYYNIETEQEFVERFPKYRRLVENILALNKCTSIRGFCEAMLSLLKEIDFESVLAILKKNNMFKQESENEQSNQLLEAVLQKLSSLSNSEMVDIFDFEQLFLLSLKSVKVETIPSYIDAVYVANATSSYFEDVDTLYVMGATANNLPRSQNDTGIIDDEDIKKLRLNFMLEPEIKVLNRRSRLKLFELLIHAKNKLLVSLPMSEEGKISQVAGFVKDLLEMFSGHVLHTASVNDFNLGLNTTEESIEKLLFCLGSKTNLSSEYFKLKQEGKLSAMLDAALSRFVEKTKEHFNNFRLNAQQKKVYSASELETYFSCPMKRLLRYVVNLQQEENIEPNKRMFGNFQHELLKLFVSNFEENKIDVDKFIENNLEKVAKTFYDEKILKRDYIIKYLKNESRIILNNVVEEQNVSAFKPLLLEEEIIFQLKNSRYIKGYVDRVDSVKNYFRIIDYKTGATENIKKELFYGKKLQLFLYANAIRKKTGMDCSGVYYFNCQTKYSKINESEKLFNGVTLKDDEVVELTDKRLLNENYKSNILGMTRKKQKGEFSFKFGNTVDDFVDLLAYATDISNLAIDEIEEGFAEAKPLQGECERCPYLSICKHTENDGERVLQQIREIKRKNNED